MPDPALPSVSDRIAANLRAKEERLWDLARRYGDVDERGQPLYTERVQSTFHHIALLLLLEAGLGGEWRAAADLARLTAILPEQTVNVKVQNASARDELVALRVRTWLRMDAAARAAYLPRLSPEDRQELEEGIAVLTVDGETG